MVVVFIRSSWTCAPLLVCRSHVAWQRLLSDGLLPRAPQTVSVYNLGIGVMLHDRAGRPRTLHALPQGGMACKKHPRNHCLVLCFTIWGYVRKYLLKKIDKYWFPTPCSLRSLSVFSYFRLTYCGAVRTQFLRKLAPKLQPERS